ncbi:hypothetical protein CBI30_06900 [Polynucleobacter aenigmaticus]|uniref:Uncharacterized protein n=1 Tax=Polynucleobacter aenigmaticus TaxID=1743164 RepID=A0A254Q7G9_9BURK|nr:hypothetical protein [Polynucleobacter aenigmaticus]OWS71462.1 hypothetical protein CBI30_06900 [Polynucleobacter aenigmaticus]
MTYKPYINPAREDARAIRNEARVAANYEAGIISESTQDMQGLTDAEYCYFLRMGNFMPQVNPPAINIMNGDPSVHDINEMLNNHKKDQDE